MAGVTIGRDDIERVLGRPELGLDCAPPLAALAHKRVLVTGAAGSLGSALVPLLAAHDISTLPTDIEQADVRSRAKTYEAFRDWQPHVVFHLAGAKHAPAGEEDPLAATLVNVIGTQNVLAAISDRARLVTASTCKSCNPETAYGATKLIAERLTLNAGHAVARFHNVVETQGNVFEIWQALPAADPLPVTPCKRYFISIREAVSLLLWSAVLPPARYAINPGSQPRDMEAVAAALYPDRPQHKIAPRRGDRVEEPFCGSHEDCFPVIGERGHIDGLMEIRSPHDPLYEGEIPIAE